MNSKRACVNKYIQLFAAAALWALISSSWVADAAPNIPSDQDKLIGDHLQLRTNVSGYTVVGATSGSPSYCAPLGSRIEIGNETNDDVFVRFLTITDESDVGLNAVDKAALSACPKEQRVNAYTSYKLPKTTVAQNEFKRTGVTFGGLVVPFKFRLGKPKELVSSSTVAPFVGFRTGWLQGWGLTFTPVVAAGLSLVPVADSTSNTTSTKSAYTIAFGVRLTSSKNEAFSAGLLYGRDFFNKADRDLDPSVAKPWVSFYLGYSI